VEIVTNPQQFEDVTVVHMDYLFNSGQRFSTEMIAGKDTIALEDGVIVIRMKVSGAEHRIAPAQVALQTSYETVMKVPIRGKQECRVCGQRTLPEYELCSMHGGVSEARSNQT
jgi:hypothetical protein